MKKNRDKKESIRYYNKESLIWGKSKVQNKVTRGGRRNAPVITLLPLKRRYNERE